MFIIIIISSTPAPGSSHQGMARAGEFPTFPIQTFPPCLLKVSQRSFPLSLAYSCTLSFHFTGGHPLAFPPSISLTYTPSWSSYSTPFTPCGQTTLKSVASLLPPLHTSSLHPLDTFQNALTHFHYSFQLFYSHHKHPSNNSFRLPAL